MTIVDIARAAGVSKSTVSLVLQGSPLVKPRQPRARSRRPSSDLGYVYHRGAANLRRSVSDVVGMVINDLTNPFFAELAVGLEAALQSAGTVPFLANTGESPARQAAGDADDARARRRRLRVCARRSAPMPLIWPRSRLGAAGGDRRCAACRRRLAEQRDARQCRRRPARHRASAAARPSADRLSRRLRPAWWSMRSAVPAGATALRQAGLPADPALAVESTPNRDGGVGGLAARAVAGRSRRPRPCASTTWSPSASSTRLRRARAGRRAATSPWSASTTSPRPRLIHPPLTTVAVDSRRLGERAAQPSFWSSSAGTAAGPQHITGEARLVVRASLRRGGRRLNRGAA